MGVALRCGAVGIGRVETAEALVKFKTICKGTTIRVEVEVKTSTHPIPVEIRQTA